MIEIDMEKIFEKMKDNEGYNPSDWSIDEMTDIVYDILEDEFNKYDDIISNAQNDFDNFIEEHRYSCDEDAMEDAIELQEKYNIAIEFSLEYIGWAYERDRKLECENEVRRHNDYDSEDFCEDYGW